MKNPAATYPRCILFRTILKKKMSSKSRFLTQIVDQAAIDRQVVQDALQRGGLATVELVDRDSNDDDHEATDEEELETFKCSWFFTSRCGRIIMTGAVVVFVTAAVIVVVLVTGNENEGGPSSAAAEARPTTLLPDGTSPTNAPISTVVQSSQTPTTRNPKAVPTANPNSGLNGDPTLDRTTNQPTATVIITHKPTVELDTKRPAEQPPTKLPNTASPSQKQTTTAPLIRKDCFETKTELQSALSEYFTQSKTFQSTIVPKYGWPMNNWCVSNIQDFSNLFQGQVDFNQDIGLWDTSNATTMNSMFSGAVSFDQDLALWDVSSVTSMYQMFLNAESFTGQGLESWDVSSVTVMTQMLYGASSFRRDLCSGTDALEGRTKFTAYSVFTGSGCSSVLDPDISLSPATPLCFSCGAEFRTKSELQSAMNLLYSPDSNEEIPGRPPYRPSIGDWNVSLVTDFDRVFASHPLFNDDISGWDVSSAVNMNGMFSGLEQFNQDIGRWQVGRVTTMQGMFVGTISFDQDLALWDVSSVTTMFQMFRSAESFTGQGLESWDVSSVTVLSQMFYGASSFRRDLCSWTDAFDGRMGITASNVFTPIRS